MKEIKRLVRCKNGHFFDGGKYDECPHCNNNKEPDVTIILDPEMAECIKENAEEKNEYTDIFSYSSPDKKQENETSENMTVHYYQRALGAEPVVGWVVCVKGFHFGEDFKIKSGRNFIGRSGSMDISLSGDKAVSRERHAILTYDPKGNVFMIQPGDSSELCYLNGQLVLIPTQLSSNDIISLGESELMFVPFCSESFKWEK